jgi:hypothetical protein
MAATATTSDVFDTAIALMDEINDSGQTQTVDTDEYKRRTPGIMNILLAECYPFSDLKDPEAADSSWRAPDEWDDNLWRIDNTLALGIMPYGLAANLLVDENPAAASYFQQRYEDLLNKKKSRAKAESGSIENVYGGVNGGIEYGYFSRW